MLLLIFLNLGKFVLRLLIVFVFRGILIILFILIFCNLGEFRIRLLNLFVDLGLWKFLFLFKFLDFDELIISFSKLLWLEFVLLCLLFLESFGGLLRGNGGGMDFIDIVLFSVIFFFILLLLYNCWLELFWELCEMLFGDEDNLDFFGGMFVILVGLYMWCNCIVGILYIIEELKIWWMFFLVENLEFDDGVFGFFIFLENVKLFDGWKNLFELNIWVVGFR